MLLNAAANEMRMGLEQAENHRIVWRKRPELEFFYLSKVDYLHPEIDRKKTPYAGRFYARYFLEPLAAGTENGNV